MTQEPEQAVVEWGGGPARGRPRWRVRWWRPDGRRVAPVLAGLAAAAGLGSLLSDWQTTTLVLPPEQNVSGETYQVGIGGLGAWGTAVVLCLAALGVCVGAALGPERRLRPYGRALGMILSAVVIGVLVAVTADLSRRTGVSYFIGGPFSDIELDLRLERGVALAYLAVALAAAACYLASAAADRAAAVADSVPRQRVAPPPDGRRGSDPEATAFGSPQVTVAPAEPFRYVTDRDEWT